MILRRGPLLWKLAFPRNIVYPKSGERLLPVCLYSKTVSGTMEASRTVEDAAGRPLTLDITEAAEERLKRLLLDKQSYLRLTVESGGCHGFTYHFSLDQGALPLAEDDVLFKRNGSRIVIDTVSLPYVAGSCIDHVSELIGSYFRVVNNPRAGAGCGCGVSFDLKPEADNK